MIRRRMRMFNTEAGRQHVMESFGGNGEDRGQIEAQTIRKATIPTSEDTVEEPDPRADPVDAKMSADAARATLSPAEPSRGVDWGGSKLLGF